MKKPSIPTFLSSFPASGTIRFQAFDLLATLVAVVRTNGCVVFANAALEDALGTSRRTIEGSQLPECFTEPHILQACAGGRGQQRVRRPALRRLAAAPEP